MHRFCLGVSLLAFVALLDCRGEKPAEAVTPAGFGVGPGRNLSNVTDKGITDDFEVRKGKKHVQKNVKWTAALGNHSYGGPTIHDGRVFVGTNNEKPRDPMVKGDKGVVMCFDEKTGAFLWQITHDKLPNNDEDFPKQGVASTPAAQGDRIWYVSNRCELVCADAVKGKVVWTVDMIKTHDVFPCQLANSSPLVLGDMVCALTGNGVDIGNETVPKPKSPAIIAVNKAMGKPLWSFALHGKIMRGQWSSPAAALVDGKWQVVFAGGDGWLYGLSAEKGELVWKFNLNLAKEKPYKAGGSGEQSFVIGVPVIVDGKCYVATGQEPDDGQGVGHLWCVDITKKPANKEKDVSIVKDELDPKAPANKDSALVWHFGGNLPKPNADGRNFDFGRTLTTACVHDGLVYASELAGYLHCLDAKTGKLQWTYDLNEGTWCSPYHVNGKILIGTDSGELYVFKAGRAKPMPRKIPIGQPVKVPPIVSNGVLYLNGDTYLYAIK